METEQRSVDPAVSADQAIDNLMHVTEQVLRRDATNFRRQLVIELVKKMPALPPEADAKRVAEVLVGQVDAILDRMRGDAL